MNGNATNKMSVGKALLLTAFLSASAPTLAAEYFLRTGTLNMAMPDGTSVAMWGFSKCSDGTFVTCENPSVPGPELTVPAGDASGLTVHLRNTLSEPVSLVINGQVTAMTPVWTDGTSGPRISATQRVRSFAAEAAPLGGTTDYVWSNLKSGTYLYQSGTHPQVQVQMGLYGAMTADAGVNQVYPGVLYDQSLTMLFSEIDPALHAAVAGGTYGDATVPGAPTSAFNYDPKFFLINGKSFAAGDAPLAMPYTGQRLLLRMINAGLRSRVPTISNGYLSLLGEDGNPYPWGGNPRQQYSVSLTAAKTIDAIFVGQTPAGVDAKYVVYDRRFALTSGTMQDGGMMANLGVRFSSNHSPEAVADSYTLVMGGTGGPTALSLPAAGVLVNDTDADGNPLTVAYYSAASVGTVAGTADGAFVYTPPTATYRGIATFSYNAKDALTTSNLAAVNVNVISNRRPLVVNDAVSVPARTSANNATYVATIIPVLINDADPDTVFDASNTINPATVATSNVTGGGGVSAVVNVADGTVSYRPPLNAAVGNVYTLRYRVRDTRGAISVNSVTPAQNYATVTVTIQ